MIDLNTIRRKSCGQGAHEKNHGRLAEVLRQVTYRVLALQRPTLDPKSKGTSTILFNTLLEGQWMASAPWEQLLLLTSTRDNVEDLDNITMTTASDEHLNERSKILGRLPSPEC